MQTSFHHDKEHSFISSVENVILTKIYTYQKWSHWLCIKRHLMPKCVTPNWWWRPTYLPTVMMCWHNVWAPCDPLAAFSVGLVQWGPHDVEGSICVGDLSVKQDFIPYVGQLLLSNVTVEWWIIDLNHIASLMVLVRLCVPLPTMEKFFKLVCWPVVLAWS